MSSLASGGLYMTNGNLEITDSKFLDNITSTKRFGYGGAIYKSGTGTSTIIGTEFNGNKLSKHTINGGGAYGGAIYINDELTIIKKCLFDNNDVSVSASSKCS